MLHGELIPAREKNSRRLMVMLHGLGDSLEGYRWWPKALDLPWLNYFLVNAPDPYYGGYSWFDFPNDIRPGILRSRVLLIELLEDLRARGFPSEETTLGGFSQGCLMTLDVGLRYPRKLAGLAGISGWVFEVGTLLQELSPVARDQRVIVTHGTLDDLLPLEPVRQEVQTLKSAGLNVEWHEFLKGHTIQGLEEIAIIRKFVRAGYPVVGK